MHAAIWTNGEATDLDLDPTSYSEATGINDNGQVVGYAGQVFDVGSRRAFVWTKDNGKTFLDNTFGTDSAAYGINNSGQVVGWAVIDNGSQRFQHAFVWTKDNGMADLGTLGGMTSRANAINDGGKIVGQVCGGFGGSATCYAVMWDNKGMGTFLGNTFTTHDSLNSAMTPFIGGRPIFEALGINAREQVVGYEYWLARAFVWSSDAGMVDLNSLVDPSLGWTLTKASAINNKGQIAATGYSPATNNARRALLLTPVPSGLGECANGGWMNFLRANGSTFKSEGDCIQYVNTGK